MVDLGKIKTHFETYSDGLKISSNIRPADMNKVKFTCELFESSQFDNVSDRNIYKARFELPEPNLSSVAYEQIAANRAKLQRPFSRLLCMPLFVNITGLINFTLDFENDNVLNVYLEVVE